MSFTLSGGQVHKDESVTLAGLQAIIKTMRWSDLNNFASEIEELRCNSPNSATGEVTADLIYAWAQS